MMHLFSFTAVNGYCWGCCAQVNLLISGMWCSSFPSPQWTDMVEAVAFRLICLFLVYDTPFFLHRSERIWLRLLHSGQFAFFWCMMHLFAFIPVNGNFWGCCAQVNWLIFGICWTFLPSPQWTDIVEASVLRVIYLFLVYVAPLFLHHSERILLRLLCSGWFTYFWYMLHLSSFTAVNGYGWGCCIQVNLRISGIWCTFLPSPQWTEIDQAAVFRLIHLFLVHVAPLFLHRS